MPPLSTLVAPRRLLLGLLLLLIFSFYCLSTLQSQGLPTTRSSNFRCVGSDADHRRCVFDHVCLTRAQTGNWMIQYGLPSPLGLKDTGVDPDAISPEESERFVALRAEAVYRKENLQYVGVQTVPWAKLVRSNNTWHEESWCAYQLTADSDMNFGHYLLDDVFGVWETLQEFGLQDSLMRIGAYKNCAQFGGLEQRCLRQEADLWPTVTKHAVASLSSMLEEGTQCFNQLVIGTGAAGGISFGSYNINRGRAFRAYRDAVYRANGVAVDGRGNILHILFVQKKGRRAFLNFESTAAALRTDPAFSSFKWTITDTFDNLTFGQQLRLLSTVDVVISPCGGLSMSFILLPTGSSLIVAAYPHAHIDADGILQSIESGHMEGHLWSAQTHVYVQHYEIEDEEDYRIPAGFPVNPSWAVYRNEAEIVLQYHKLRKYLARGVQQATSRRTSLFH